MSTLWKRVKALSRYHAAHQRQYPGGFSLPGLAKTTIMVKRLTTMTEPPLHKSDFMTDFEVRYQLDKTLTKGLEIVLPQIREYLEMDDSRDVLKEPTHDTRNVDKELSDDSQDVNKDTVDDSRNVLKDWAPETIEWGYSIEAILIATGLTLRTSPSVLPALEALAQATRIRVLMEEGGSDNNDNSDDETPVVKMEVDPPLKIKGEGTSGQPLDLTSESDSDKENDHNHPGPTWMLYDQTNAGHYCIDIPEDDMTTTALYIRYVFDGEETIIEGCDGKQTPVYRKALHARSADTRPNLSNDKLIRDNHLHVLHPQAHLKELVD